LASDAVEYNQLFAGIIEDWARKEGISEEAINQLQQEFLDVWGKQT